MPAPPATEEPRPGAGRELYEAIHSEVVAEEPALRKLLVSVYDARLATWTSLDEDATTPPPRHAGSPEAR